MKMVYYGKAIYRNSFAHHGIKGQKWGVRRFQNVDGSLTEAGKRRYYGPGSGISANFDANNAVAAGGGGGDPKDDLEKAKDKIDEMNLFEMKKELKRLEETSPNSVLVNYLKTEMRKKENADLDTASRAAKAQKANPKEADTAQRAAKAQEKKTEETNILKNGKNAVGKILDSLTPKHNTTTTRVSIPTSKGSGNLSNKDMAKYYNSLIDKEKAARSAPKGSAAYVKQKIKEQEVSDAHANAGKMSNKDLAKYYTWLLDRKKKK